MSAQQVFQRAIDQAKRDGYTERDDGRWVTPDGTVLREGVDPKPVQEDAIEFAFSWAVEEDDLDIFTTRGIERTLVREGDPLPQNFERVVEAFQASSMDVAEAVADQLETMGEDLDAYMG